MTFNLRNLSRAFLMALTVSLLSAAGPALAADKCDPLVTDGAALESVRTEIDRACPCGDYNGSEGKGRSDFKRCISAQITQRIAALEVRKVCKGALKKMYSVSVCGLGSSELAPCVEETASGKVRCKIRTVSECQDRSGDVCLGKPTCVDAADTNGDMTVDAEDSGLCFPVPTTTTSTTTTSTTSTTSTTDTTSTTSTTDTTTTTIPVLCSDASPDIEVVVRRNDEEEVVQETPCPPPFPASGGCELDTIIDGSMDMVNIFDASGTTDGRVCSQDDAALSYEWKIFASTPLQHIEMYAPWIRGYDSPVLEIPPSSLPALADTDSGDDHYYRVRLTVTPVPLDGEEFTPAPTVLWFRFLYQSTEMTLDCYRDSLAADSDVCGLCGIYPHFCDAW